MNKIELSNYQKNNIPSVKIGTVIFQTDGDIGYYEYTKNGWVKLTKENMNNYQREKNGRKWLVAVVSGMVVLTIVCCVIAFNLYKSGS